MLLQENELHLNKIDLDKIVVCVHDDEIFCSVGKLIFQNITTYFFGDSNFLSFNKTHYQIFKLHFVVYLDQD